MASRIGFTPPIVLTGGVVKDTGIKSALEKEIGHELIIPEEPQIIRALGGAVFSRNQADKAINCNQVLPRVETDA